MNIKFMLKNNKKYLRFMFIVFLIGFFLGFLVFLKCKNQSIFEEIKNISTYLNTTPINYILYHLVLFSVLFLCSLTFLGILLFPFCFLFEGISFAVLLSSFMQVFHGRGLIFSILYFVITKSLFLLLFLLLFKRVLQIVKVLRNKKENEKVVKIKKRGKQIIILFFLILANDCILYFFGSKILSFLLFIIP